MILILIVYGLHQCSFLFVGDDASTVPPGASVNHVEDNNLAIEHQVALDLVVEGI